MVTAQIITRQGGIPMHRRILAHLMLIAIFALGLTFPSTALARQTPALDSMREVRDLIETYGPIIVFHSEEQFFMDNPEAVLDSSSQLVWGTVENPDDFDTFSMVTYGSTKTSSRTLLRDVANVKALDPTFEYWLTYDESLYQGRLKRAKTFVHVLPINADNTLVDFQFWFFYPFNGPVKAHATIPGVYDQYFFPDTIGRHMGDWEHVTLRFAFNEANQEWVLSSLFLSQHDGGQWVTPSSVIPAGSTHPVIYAAKDSHAHYATVGEHPFQLVLQQPVAPGLTLTANLVDFVDDTGANTRFDSYRPGNYTIVSSALPGVEIKQSPDWLHFDGRWGPYEKQSYVAELDLFGQTLEFPFNQIGSGPIGPAQKDVWYTGDPMP
jgi:hypothetical protein